ncbi:diguanylate cyclase (GGDEF)-like protein [Motilibacter peucedani]|uniref:Diguanylate cyclase (GGDEF)-like protein n=1 Tax=Motilibacter peucedani TaxID=598650 RepID=A0A420XKA0_9ACTN|nr:diguanylate cyclase [Motilibacter peucedani]RKS68056.1 diguanylate cyclase (GGDEF)-like protein [Motilibacter peucedani]
MADQQQEPGTAPGGAVGVLSPLVGGFYYGALLQGIADAAGDRGVVALQTLEAGNTHAEYVEPPAYDLDIAAEHVVGYVSVVNAVSAAQLDSIVAAGRPLVLVSTAEEVPGRPRVVPDNATGVREAVEHLLAHGHTRIGFVGNLVQSDMRARYDAYLDTLGAAGLVPGEELFFEAPDNLLAGGRAAAATMLERGLPSTAVVCATDLNAFGVLDVLAEADVPVPGRQAVVGFDDMDEAASRTPSLASVSLQFDLLGARATGLLLAQVRGERPTGTHPVPTRFVRRESCGCDQVVVRGPEAGGRDARQVLLDELFQVAGGYAAVRPVAERAARAADTAARALLAGGELEVEQLRAAFEEVYRAAPDAERAGELAFALRRHVTRLATVLVPGGAVAPEVADRVDDLLLRLLRVLSRDGRRRHYDELTHLAGLLHSQYAISVDLLQSDRVDPRSLSWLRSTGARSGCFAAWAGARLRVDGVYDETGESGVDRQALLGGEFSARQFPPADLLAAARRQGDVAFVIPVSTGSTGAGAGRRWGLLATVGPVEAQVATGRETANQWAALLAVALEHERMVADLRRQREDLASAVLRERQLAEGLRSSEERYALASAAANDGLWDWDLSAGAIYLSPRWADLVGVPAGALSTGPHEWLGRVHPDDLPALQAALDDTVEGRVPALEAQHRLHTGAGGWRWMLSRALRVVSPSGEVRLVGSLTDVHARRTLEEQLRHEASFDALTGLPNRALFLRRLTAAVERAAEGGTGGAVLFIDLDGFKAVNDTLGHAAGDELLVEVARRMEEVLRGGDTAARLGGDEFAVLLDGTAGRPEAERAAQRLQDAIGRPVQLGATSVTVSASIGVAAPLDGSSAVEAVLRCADEAMYAAKAAGKATYRCAA